MKYDVDDKNRCRLVCVKFHQCRFAVAVAKCLGGSLFGTQCIVIYPLSCIQILSTVISSRLYIHHLKTQQAFTWSKLLLIFCASAFAWGALTLLVGHQEEHSTCKIEWWGVGVVLCLERGADCLHMVQLMPLHPETPSPLASFKSRLVLPFWYQLSQVVLEKRPLDGCSVLVKVGDWAGQSIWYVSLHLTIENRTSRNFWCTNLIANATGPLLPTHTLPSK